MLFLDSKQKSVILPISSSLLRLKNAVYLLFEDGAAHLKKLIGNPYKICIPYEVSSPDGKMYKVIRVGPNFEAKLGSVSIIEFEKASEIEEIPAKILFSCKSVFFLPPRIKRVTTMGGFTQKIPKIVSSGDNRFVSTNGRSLLYNNHPLEILILKTRKPSLTIRETVKFIGNYCFAENENLVSVVFPSSIENIGMSSFTECINLCFISFMGNSRLKVINGRAFYGTAIERVDFPSSLEEIGCYAFNMCEKLKSISFPKDTKLKFIRKFSFALCKELVSVSFPNDLKLTTLEACCFSKTRIEFFEVPAPVDVIGKYAFKDCEHLESISFSLDSKLRIIEERAFSNIIIESLVVTPSVEVIEESAFDNCTRLKSITFAKDSKLRIIGKRAFYKASIDFITIPPSVEIIGESAFSYCTKLKSVSFNESTNLRKIESKAFFNTAVRTIDIPSHVEDVGKLAFNSCKRLKSITWRGMSLLNNIKKNFFS